MENHSAQALILGTVGKKLKDVTVTGCSSFVTGSHPLFEISIDDGLITGNRFGNANTVFEMNDSDNVDVLSNSFTEGPNYNIDMSTCTNCTIAFNNLKNAGARAIQGRDNNTTNEIGPNVGMNSTGLHVSARSNRHYDTGGTTLTSDTIPAGTMRKEGDWVRITACVQVPTGPATATTIRLNDGGGGVDVGVMSLNANSTVAYATTDVFINSVGQTGASNTDYQYHSQASDGHDNANSGYNTRTVDWSQDVDIEINRPVSVTVLNVSWEIMSR
jgi:hypothetical protein